MGWTMVKGLTKRTFVHNPWTQTTILEWAWGGERVALGGDGEGRKTGNNCNGMHNANKTKKREDTRFKLRRLFGKQIQSFRKEMAPNRDEEKLKEAKV